MLSQRCRCWHSCVLSVQQNISYHGQDKLYSNCIYVQGLCNIRDRTVFLRFFKFLFGQSHHFSIQFFLFKIEKRLKPRRKSKERLTTSQKEVNMYHLNSAHLSQVEWKMGVEYSSCVTLICLQTIPAGIQQRMPRRWIGSFALGRPRTLLSIG